VDLAGIRAAALAELDESGDLRLTRVAARLGVSHSTLYHHVANRRELLVLTAEAALDEITWPEPSPDWRGYTLACGEALWSALERHPGLAQHLQTLPGSPPRLTELTGIAAAHLRTLGVDEGDALTAIIVLGHLGIAGVNSAMAFALAGEPDTFAVAHTNFRHRAELLLDGMAFRKS
jgi:AcrR family transcriptional regulator